MNSADKYKSCADCVSFPVCSISGKVNNAFRECAQHFSEDFDIKQKFIEKSQKLLGTYCPFYKEK